jgi:glucose/mannose-6-phosphate isomerase
LFDKDTLEKYDVMGMGKVYDNWSSIARESYNSDLEVIDFDNIDHIVFAGMGGSGAIGDVFTSILSKTNIHVSVVKGYQLPNTVDENTMTVVTSISGNTDEPLYILKQLKNKQHKTIAFSSGGLMEGYCNNNNINYRKLNQCLSPRTSFTTFLYGILKVLEPVIPIKKEDIEDSLKNLEKLSLNISSKNLTDSNRSLKLAEWIKEVPLIYYPSGLQSAAIRFKNSLQENSKIHVISEDVIEACHNGIVPWERSTNIQPILIQGKDDHEKTKERWKILKEYFQSKNIPYWEINTVEGRILTKIMNLIYELDYCSIYLAVLNKIDPNSVDSIDFVKKRLKEL